MAEETLQQEPGVPVVALDTASAAREERGPHGDPLTPEQIADIRTNKDVAALSYLWLLSVVIYYHHRASPFISYHAKQGMWLFAFSIPIFLVPGIGHFLSFFTLAGMIIGFLNAAHGHYHDVPIIGKLAKGQLTLGDIGKKALRRAIKAAFVLEKGVMPRQSAEDPNSQSPDPKPKRGIASYLPFGKIPFLKRKENPQDIQISAEPPAEVDRLKAMMSLSALPTADTTNHGPVIGATLSQPARPKPEGEGGSNGPLSALPVADETERADSAPDHASPSPHEEGVSGSALPS